MNSLSVPFLEAVQDVSAGNVKIPQSEFLPSGSLAIVDQGQSLVAGYTGDARSAVKTRGPVIVFGDHTRAFKYVDFPFAMGADGVKVLRAREGFDSKFVYHYLKSCSIPSGGYSRHFKFLKDISVPRPTLDEQRRIAAILDQADALRAKRHLVLSYLDALTRSMFNDMFSRDTPRARLGDLTRTSSGGTPDRSVREFFGGGIPWVKSGELHAELVTTTGETLTPLGLESSSAKLLKPGSILVAMYGATAGVVAELGIEAATNQAICALEPGPRVQGPFLGAALRAMSELLLSLRTGGAQPNLSLAKLRDVEIPVPSWELQSEFARRVLGVERERSLTRAALAIEEGLFASLQSRAFTGEL